MRRMRNEKKNKDYIDGFYVIDNYSSTILGMVPMKEGSMQYKECGN